ncbi:MFS transporter [Leuconostoc sp. JNUCC 76]
MMAVLIATFMTSVETTIITTALPTIVSHLNGLSFQSWVFATYLLTTALSTPIYGKLSDRWGRKPVFMIGLLIFSIGSLLCGLANNIILLILFRGLQGIGAGAIMPITFTIIADLFDYERRSTMLALNNTAWGISALLGPLLGGYIVETLSWHWVFFINVPLGLLVFLIVFFKYNEKSHRVEKHKIDYKGILFLSSFLLILLITFQNLGNFKINLSLITCLILLIIILGILFYKTEKNASDPIIPLELFRNRVFSIQISTALLLSAIQIGFQTYFPMWLQAIYKSSAALAGLAVTPSPIFWLISSFFVGALVKKWPPKKISLPLILLMSVFYFPLTVISSSFPQLIFYIISAITGITLGIIITMNTLVSQRVITDSNLGTASAMLTLGRTLGQTIATGILGLTFNLTLNSGIQSHGKINSSMINNYIGGIQSTTNIKNYESIIRQTVLSGMHNVFIVVMLIFAIALIINIMDKNNSIIN